MIETFPRCTKAKDFIAHAQEMEMHCLQCGEETGDRDEKIAWKAKAQTWCLVARWLEELPNGGERE
jgi:hypothetical protein